jgi:hypothetical protein
MDAPTTTPAELLAKLDRKRIAARLGVSEHALTVAAGRGRLSASWFAAISEECAGDGIACPPELFGMKGFDASAEAAE